MDSSLGQDLVCENEASAYEGAGCSLVTSPQTHLSAFCGKSPFACAALRAGFHVLLTAGF